MVTDWLQMKTATGKEEVAAPCCNLFFAFRSRSCFSMMLQQRTSFLDQFTDSECRLTVARKVIADTRQGDSRIT